MQLFTTTIFKTVCHAIATIHRSLSIKTLFAIDTLSLLLFAIVILGLANNIPANYSIIIQSLFVGITLYLTLHFLQRRLKGMVMFKISMLLILYLLNYLIFVS